MNNQKTKRTVKQLVMAATLALSMMMFSGIASAHVTVQPQQVPAGSYQVMAVRVPSEEKGVNTVKVQVKVPAEIKVSRVEPKEGWKYELEKDAGSKITAITWTADNAGLSETEFTEFRVSGKVADDANQLVWKAYQTYSDGTLVEWVGGEGADKPASVTTVTEAAASDGAQSGHDAGSGTTDSAGDTSVSSGKAGQESGSQGTAEPAASTTGESETDKGNDNALPLILSIIAVVLSAISLIVSLTRKKR